MRTYLAVLLFVAPLFSACTGSKPPTSVDDGLREAHAQAAALERETATRLVELDRRIEKGPEGPSDKRLGKPIDAFPREEERQLYVADVTMNRALEGLYTKAWQSETGDGELRAALLHWTVLIRRALMRDFHTRVPGLEDDPDCAGDIVGDGMFLRYFEAVLAHHEVNAALALADLARQSACLGVSQSSLLASVLVSTFDDLRAFLRLNGHEDIVPYVVQAGSAPLLLFYDVEKYRGLESPLARWFRENRDILIEGVESGRQPSRWHGLWLYDRRTGRLFGFKATPKPVDENDVNLARFFASITQLENLGEAGCSFAEMVERGAGAHGYFCAGSTCGRDVSGRGAASGSRIPVHILFGLTGLEKTFDRAICGEAGDGPGDRGGGPKCGDDPGHNREADTVRCLTKQVVHAGTEGFHCLGETSGRCGAPVGSLVKDFQPQPYAGIKIGPDCALSTGMGDLKLAEWAKEHPNTGMGDLKLAEWKQEERERQRLERAEELYDKYSKESEEFERLRKESNDLAAEDYQNYLKLKKEAEAAGRDPEADPKVLKAKEVAKETAKVAEEIAKEANEAQRLKEKARQNLEEKKEKEEKKKKEDEKKRLDEEKRKEKEKKEKEKKEKEKGVSHCVRDDPNCGDDLCTGMSQGTRETLACIQAALSDDPAGSSTPKPGFCDPRTCDPIEPDPGAPGTLACFDTMAKDTAAVTAKLCWSMRCAEGQVPVTGLNGCTCREGGGSQSVKAGGVNNFCTKMLCSDGTPTYQDGRCTCSGGGANVMKNDFGGYGGLSPKKLQPVFGAPATYSEVRYGPNRP